MSTLLNKKMMMKALNLLDRHLNFEVRMILGGGGAMVLAHDYPIGTYDIDAVPIKIDFSKLDVFVKKIAKELSISPDWLNPYFATFAHTLPSDYSSRLITVFDGHNLKVEALGREDMLILKLFAGRQKDVAHARLLINKGANLKFIEKHLNTLKKKRIPGVDKALDFLDDLSDESSENSS